jgi:hypothetical protein
MLMSKLPAQLQSTPSEPSDNNFLTELIDRFLDTAIENVLDLKSSMGRLKALVAILRKQFEANQIKYEQTGSKTGDAFNDEINLVELMDYYHKIFGINLENEIEGVAEIVKTLLEESTKSGYAKGFVNLTGLFYSLDKFIDQLGDDTSLGDGHLDISSLRG